MKHRCLNRYLGKIPHKRFLMHGSPVCLRRQCLIPRKPAFRFRNRPELGKKRVYATAANSIALLHAVICSPSWAWSWCYMPDEYGKYYLYVWPRSGQRLFAKRYGYVYIVPRSTFRSVQNVLIYGSRVPVRPVKVIRVAANTVFRLLEEDGCRFVQRCPETPSDPGRYSRPRRVRRPW